MVHTSLQVKKIITDRIHLFGPKPYVQYKENEAVSRAMSAQSS